MERGKENHDYHKDQKEVSSTETKIRKEDDDERLNCYCKWGI